MGSEWKKQEQSRRTTNSKWGQYDTSFVLFEVDFDRSEPEFKGDFWTIRPVDSIFGRARYSIKLTPILFFGLGGLVGPQGRMLYGPQGWTAGLVVKTTVSDREF